MCIVEQRVGQTWPAIRRELERIALGTFTGPAGTFRRHAAAGTELTAGHKTVLAALDLPEPPRIFDAKPAT
jgi:hypothetical protein